MLNTENNCLNAKNSTVRTTSAHETCTQFLMFIHERYPRLKCLTYKKCRKWYVFRAQIKCRRLYTHGYTPEFAMMHFMRQIMYKAFPETPINEPKS